VAEVVAVNFKAVGVGEVTSSFKGISDSFKRVSKSISDRVKTVRNFFKELTAGATDIKSAYDMVAGSVRKVVAFVRGMITTTAEFAKLGGEIQGVRTSFEGLTSTAGILSEELLTKTRAALDGTVGDLEIMKAANTAIQLGLPVTAESMAELADTAQRLGRATGRDAALALADLTTGIGRQSRMILDNLGILVDTEAAYKAYAATLGKSAEQLTDAEKKVAFFNATMEGARATVASMGEEQLTAADQLARVSVAWGNIREAIAEVIATSPGFTALTNTIVEQLKRVLKWVLENREWLTDFFNQVFAFVGKAVVVLVDILVPAIANVMSAIKVAVAIATPFLSILKGIAGLVTAVFGGITAPAFPAAAAAGASPAVTISPEVNVAVTQSGIATRRELDRAFDEVKRSVFGELDATDREVRRQATIIDVEARNKLYRT